MNKIDGLNFGETIYCIEQDIEEYIQNNNLEEDENLNLILKEIENLPKFKEVYNKQLQQLKVENEQLKEKIKTYEKMFNNEEFRVALTDVRTGERELWQKYKPRMIKYKQCIDEINEVCQVNAINTCWTALNQCDNCEEKEECGTQSPFVKLDIIRSIIKKTKDKL